MPQPQSLPKPSDRWIPWMFFAFFGLLVLVLVPMGIIAVRTNSGIVTADAYEKGLAYNSAIQAQQQQESLKWRGDVTTEILASGHTKADFSLTDASGAPLAGAAVKVWFVRPAQDGIDQQAEMREQSSGHYVAELTLPARGLWEARVSATKDGHNFQIIKRVILP